MALASINLRLESDIVSLWPQTCLGCLVHTAAVSADADAVWLCYSNAVEKDLKTRLGAAELTAMPGIADARRALKTFGADPGRYRVSSEALYRRVRQDKPLPRINSIVDTNNLLSVETGFSFGSYNIDRAGNEIVLRRGQPGELYEGVGGKKVPLAGIPVLCDDRGPFGNPVSDSPRTLVTPETVHILTVIYGFSGKERTEQALELAARRFTGLAGSAVSASFLVF